MNKNNQLTHDFLKFLMDNYGVRLTMNEKDSEIFERTYPDLVERLEKENADD